MKKLRTINQSINYMKNKGIKISKYAVKYACSSGMIPFFRADKVIYVYLDEFLSYFGGKNV